MPYNFCNLYKRYLRIGLCFLLAIVWIVTGSFSASAAVSPKEGIELTFTIGAKEYTANGGKKLLESSPLLSRGIPMLPVETVFKELGYVVKINAKDKSLSASKEGTVIQVKPDLDSAVVNDENVKLDVRTKIVDGKLYVPVSFLSAYSGFTVIWDASTKTVKINSVVKSDTGKILFYEKKTDNQNSVYYYNGEELKRIPMTGKEVVNWFSYKGKVLATIFDRTKNNNNFVMFAGDTFKTLIRDFDIKDTFEFNRNLLIHGYDRSQKLDKLYRFDGIRLHLVQNNFCVGEHIEFKDKLLINKYDNARNYSLLVFDKNSWEPSILKDGFIMKGFMDDGDLLYMTGIWQKGTNRPLASYNGMGTAVTDFRIIHENIPIDIEKFAVLDGKIYAIVEDRASGMDKDLKMIDNNYIWDVGISTTTRYYNNTYQYLAIKKFNGKIYLGVDRNTKANAPASVVEMTAANNARVLIDEFQLKEFRLESNRLIALGNQKTDAKSYKDPAMYIYTGSSLSRALDVLKIRNTLTSGDRLYMDVRDKDRISGKERNTLLLHTDAGVKNLIVDFDMKNWASVGRSLILAGYEADIRKNKLYSYSLKFNQLQSSFEIKNWSQLEDKLFVNGYDPDTRQYSLYKFSTGVYDKLRDGIEVLSIIKAKGNQYLMNASEKDKACSLCGKKVLYIYDDNTKVFALLKLDISVNSMVYVNR